MLIYQRLYSLGGTILNLFSRYILFFRLQRVDGWLAFLDYLLLTEILACQCSNNLLHDLCEIGVHHGKSALPLLCTTPATTRLHCIDLFKRQNENLDNSGRGDLSIFKSNLSKFHIPHKRVLFHISSSLEIPQTFFALFLNLSHFSILMEPISMKLY